MKTLICGLLLLFISHAWNGALWAQEAENQSTSTPNTITLAEGAKSAPIEIDEFQWLAGIWEGTGLGGECTELWSAPKAGSLVGSFCFMNNDEIQFTEHFVLQTAGKSVTLKLKHFDKDLHGWEEKNVSVEFPFVRREGDNFFFSGLTYRKIENDKMEVYVQMKNKDGKVSEAKFEFLRVR